MLNKTNISILLLLFLGRQLPIQAQRVYAANSVLATGNWIKVVQRLPVRIELDPEELKLHPLQVGLSMQVDIDVSDYKK